MNARWHDKHRLPRSATLAERIAWHLEHQKECACRPIPAKLLAQMPAAGRKKAAAKKAAANKTATTSKLDPKFDRVIAAFAEDPQVSSGKMMASVGLKVNGKIFAMLVKGKFVAKLPKERVNELVESGKGEYFDPRNDGRLMKEWVVLRAATPPWISVAKEAHRFVNSK